MEQLASRLKLSCHLTVLHGEQFMVIARIEPEWLMGWSVKLGAVFPLTQQYASAKVLAAFQLEGRRQELADVIAEQDRISGKKALAALDRISAEGGNFSNDDGYTRILAYSCPILEASGRAVAALTVPLVRQDKIPADEAATIASELRTRRRSCRKKSAPAPAPDHPAVIPSSTTQAAPLTCAAPRTPGRPRHRRCFQARRNVLRRAQKPCGSRPACSSSSRSCATRPVPAGSH